MNLSCTQNRLPLSGVLLGVILFFVMTLSASAQDPAEREARRAANQYFQSMNQGSNNGQQGHTIDAMSSSTLNGHTSSERFGISVASAGDVNGDGFADVIVGAHAYNSYTGRAYIYYGGLQMDNTADIILEGNAVSNFGWSVAGLGDVNGDGYSDVIVGAWSENSNTGKAYVYCGGPEMDQYYDLVLTGEGANNYFGTTVAGAGDVNGDGLMDMLVGANGNNGNSGKAYIFYGAPILDFLPDVTLTGDAGGYFASKVAGIGDINGDGFADVAIGEHPWNGNTGKVFVFYGGSPMNSVADVTMTGTGGGSYFGFAIAGNGDINGDGYGDMVIGEYGMLYANVYYGGPLFSGVATVIINSPLTGSGFGAAVALADINGDGYSDILVGAYGENSNTGKVYGYFGGATLNRIADILIPGETTGSTFASALCSLGDINNDGFEDLAVGAYAYSGTRGRVYVYKNGLTGNDIPDRVFTPPTLNPYYGNYVSNTGDVNGDGYDDMLVSAEGTSPSVAGKVYLFFGGPYNLNTSPYVFTGDSAGFGGMIAGKGDLNGDGYADVVISDPNFGLFRGKIYIYWGGASMDVIADLTITGDSAYRYLGYSMDKSGDVNGDGYDDLIVGAPGSDYRYRYSYVYVYNGSPSFSTTPSHSWQGAFIGDGWGQKVCSGGDVNGDGIDDFAILSAKYPTAYKSTVTVLFGGSDSLLGYMGYNLTSDSSASGSTFGYGMCMNGDVNGDGFDDLIIGDQRANNSYGIIRIYLGGILPHATADFTLQAAYQAGIGAVLNSGGDVNGDGYDDILNINHMDGSAIVYFGGASIDATPDINMPMTSTQMHNALTFVGDQNNDGLSDVLCGLVEIHSYNSSGRAHLYLSSAPKPAPRIASIKDVPGDQGGKVNITFIRSGWDVRNSPKNIYYTIERSAPPVNGHYAWEYLDGVSATTNLYYNFTAETQSDSLTGNPGLFYFRVTARSTVYAAEFWRSNIMVGHSVDNLAPAVVKNFTAGVSGAANRLSWKANTENDLKQYRIYRSTETTIDPNTAGVFAITTDTVYLDNAPLNYAYNYFIVAEDIHNNIGAVTSAPAPSSAVNLTAFLEGFYNETLNQQISDTVHLYLRDIASPYAIVDECAGVLDNNGAGQFKFYNAASGNYYLVLKHRNSIQTWSKLGGEALVKGASFNYDFTTSSSQAYSDNMILKGSKWCVFGGDVNQDDIVDFTDMSMIDNDAYNYLSGYLVTDATGDNFVDFSDLSLADNNSYNYVSAVYPNSMKKTPAPRGTLKTKYIPKQYSISDGYPNPFNPSTRLNITLPKESKVTVIVYNTLGETIRTLVDEVMPAGFHNLYLNLPNAASGTYLVRFTADNYVQTKKIILMK